MRLKGSFDYAVEARKNPLGRKHLAGIPEGRLLRGRAADRTLRNAELATDSPQRQSSRA
jgi:hypothetical protein